MKRFLHLGAQWLAGSMPTTCKVLLWVWARVDRYLPNHRRWVAVNLANRLGYRIPVNATLRNGMKATVIWNDFIGAEIYYKGSYEDVSLRIIRELVTPGMIFADVGAHIGQYTLVASELVGNSGQVHAFEPDPQTFDLLSRNVKRNGLRNVTANRVALAARAGSTELYLGDAGHIGFNSLRPPKDCDSGRACVVECMMLPAYLQSSGLTAIDFLKIDVEGAEMEVLKSAGHLLSGDSAPFILIEFNPHSLEIFGSSIEELERLLSDCGYSLFAADEFPLHVYVREGHAHNVFNVLAVPRQHKQVIQTPIFLTSAERSILAAEFSPHIS